MAAFGASLSARRAVRTTQALGMLCAVAERASRQARGSPGSVMSGPANAGEALVRLAGVLPPRRAFRRIRARMTAEPGASAAPKAEPLG